MIDAHRCRVRSPATARRCTLARLHLGDHERRGRRGGILESWPQSATDGDFDQVCTYAELLEHLRDLIDLAKAEGFGRVVATLERADRELRAVVATGARHRRARPDRKFWDRA